MGKIGYLHKSKLKQCSCGLICVTCMQRKVTGRTYQNQSVWLPVGEEGMDCGTPVLFVSEKIHLKLRKCGGGGGGGAVAKS